MMTADDIKAAINDVVREQLGAGLLSVDVAFDEDRSLESDVIKITITVKSSQHLNDGGVFNLPNTLRQKLLSLHEPRFPLVQYNLASA
jgi:hypothetical protein